jgi:hypothetical protein
MQQNQEQIQDGEAKKGHAGGMGQWRIPKPRRGQALAAQNR